jgi:hypothetical protein
MKMMMTVVVMMMMIKVKKRLMMMTIMPIRSDSHESTLNISFLSAVVDISS